MSIRTRKLSQAIQRKRMQSRLKQKLNCRRHAQFIQETHSQLAQA
ncbi:hypothetical protein [Thalassotalea piscium]|uniref:Uncharacterized protein n=1 Tax=Thalassotalea piscium TaxID=1230533 RepID=A0A7X0NJD6_9GAMM|nr:hypothetical protein [Thalassotalea piscium]MBB6544505.1 hypothetical protein [Thalassotalea piscium]